METCFKPTSDVCIAEKLFYKVYFKCEIFFGIKKPYNLKFQVNKKLWFLKILVYDFSNFVVYKYWKGCIPALMMFLKVFCISKIKD